MFGDVTHTVVRQSAPTHLERSSRPLEVPGDLGEQRPGPVEKVPVGHVPCRCRRIPCRSRRAARLMLPSNDRLSAEAVARVVSCNSALGSPIGWSRTTGVTVQSGVTSIMTLPGNVVPAQREQLAARDPREHEFGIFREAVRRHSRCRSGRSRCRMVLEHAAHVAARTRSTSSSSSLRTGHRYPSSVSLRTRSPRNTAPPTSCANHRRRPRGRRSDCATSRSYSELAGEAVILRAVASPRLDSTSPVSTFAASRRPPPAGRRHSIAGTARRACRRPNLYSVSIVARIERD